MPTQRTPIARALMAVARIQAVALASLWAAAPPLGAQPPRGAVDEAVSAMSLSAGAPVSVTRSRLTGYASFLASAPGHPVPVLDPRASTPEERAVSFLAEHGRAFGIRSTGGLRVSSVQAGDEVGMDHVRLQQVHNGVAVTGGELVVHLAQGGVVAVGGKTLPGVEKVDTTPVLTPIAAEAAVRRALEKLEGRSAAETHLGAPRLEILNRGLLEGRPSPSHLAWFVEATGPGLREYVWIDARRGTVALQFSQLAEARNRRIHNGGNGPALPGVLVRVEGGAVTGDGDADNAYVQLGDAYDYFLAEHGRDSYDGAGAALVATVHSCPSSSSCPMQNAFWNGQQMVFGEGFPAADDVAAHELTHAVTERTARLFYYMQSGALNESFSDIFGEAVDLSNGRGNDTPQARWLLGEDVPGFGAIRNMMNPNQFQDPASLADTAYFACPASTSYFPADGGGVHTNSGVPNHAFALLVDGGSFGGQSVSGIGLSKAARVHYRALTRYLVSASDFADHDRALRQSCADLVGTGGMTQADCDEVAKALDAVQLAAVWPCAPSQPARPLTCPFNYDTVPKTIFFDDFEKGLSNWTIYNARGSTGFGLGSFLGPFATSGTGMLWGYDPPEVTDARAEMRPVLIPPALASDVRMLFNHSYGFDDVFGPPWDGGVLEYRVDAQPWNDAGYLILDGARYGTSPIRWEYGNPLGGRLGFTGDSYGYVTTQLYIPNAQAVQVRFRLGADDSVDDYGWFIDDVRIYACVGPFLEVQSPNGGESLPAGSLQQIRWDGATSLEATLELSYTDGTTTVPIATLPASATSHLWRVPPPATATGRIVIRARVGGNVESSDTSDADFAVTAAVPAPPRLDFDGDGQGDLLWHHQVDGDLYTWLLTGTVASRGSYLDPSRFADTRWQIRGLADFDGDGKIDILWHHQGTGDLYVWFMDGTVATGGSYLTPRSFSDTRWQIRGVADLDHDGQADILWHHQTTGDLYVWFMSGLAVSSGSYLTPSRFPDTLWQIRGLADLNRDGQPDLLWHHQGTGDLYVWFLSGTAVSWGSYLTPSRFADTRWQIRRVADFDGDGQLDLLWHHQATGELYVWFLDGIAVTSGSYLTPKAFTDTRWQIMPR